MAEILFHGTRGDRVLSIIETGVLRPGADQAIYFSRFEWSHVLSYGADATRRASFVLKLQVEIPNSVGRELTSIPGAPSVLKAVTSAPLRATVLEMYVRGFDVHQQFTFNTIVGAQAITGFIQAMPLRAAQ